MLIADRDDPLCVRRGFVFFWLNTPIPGGSSRCARLALHYGVKGVRGGEFRKVRMEQPERRGLLGKGAVLMATSYANRTSPVVRATLRCGWPSACTGTRRHV
jgi:hypothetical protein